MTLHLYLIKSTYTPIYVNPEIPSVTFAKEEESSSLLIKIFSSSLTAGQSERTPANSGEYSVATLVVADKVTCHTNPSISDLEKEKLNKIKTIAEDLLTEQQSPEPFEHSLCKFAKEVKQFNDVVIYYPNHDISS